MKGTKLVNLMDLIQSNIQEARLTKHDFINCLIYKHNDTTLSCPKCGAHYKSWHLFVQCAVCAVPQWPEGRHVKAAATLVVHPDGSETIYYLPAPYRHGHVLHVPPILLDFSLKEEDTEQGFIDNHGHWLSRPHARTLAERKGQILVDGREHTELFSEEVW